MLERKPKEVLKTLLSYLRQLIGFLHSVVLKLTPDFINKDNYNPSSTTFKVILIGNKVKLSSSCSLKFVNKIVKLHYGLWASLRP